MMKTLLMTNDPAIAVDAEAAGVSRIMVDLETLGKKERQASRTTFISTHQKEDVAKIRAAVSKAELMVRVNGWNPNWRSEIDHAIDNGTDLLMLPMILNMAQFEAMVSHVNGRVRLIPLVETSYSMAHIAEIAGNPAVSEIYMGLNDLHLSLGLDFLFEPLAVGLLDWMAERIKAAGKPFGFGGIAKMGSGELPAQRILGEHVRMGSTCVILSSRFAKDVAITESAGRRERLLEAMKLMQDAYRELSARSEAQQRADAAETAAIIMKLARNLRKPA